MILDDWRKAAPTLPVNPFYGRVLPYLQPGSTVLDAGAGLGTGAQFMADRGFDVTALEPDPELFGLLLERNYQAIQGRFIDAPLDDFDAVLTVFSLFFVPESEWNSSWLRLSSALRNGGIWGGQILGERDEWAATQPVSTLSREQIGEMLSGWEILEWQEFERPGRTAWGAEKQWHIHHIIARKMGVPQSA